MSATASLVAAMPSAVLSSLWKSRSTSKGARLQGLSDVLQSAASESGRRCHLTLSRYWFVYARKITFLLV